MRRLSDVAQKDRYALCHNCFEIFIDDLEVREESYCPNCIDFCLERFNNVEKAEFARDKHKVAVSLQ